jgi:polar amino acid transport system permease protein
MLDLAPGTLLGELWQARGAFAPALLVTARVAFGAIVLGVVLGFGGALGLVYGAWWLRAPLRAYVTVMRGVPPLVALFFIYYGVGVLGGAMPAEVAGIAALTLFATAQTCETFRGAIESIPRGQVDAAKSIGLTFRFRLLDVVMPQATRRALPSIVNTAVDMVKASPLVSTIGASDLLLTSQEFAARTFLIVEVYLVCWLLYLALNLLLTNLGRRLEERFRPFTA